jgi:transposase
VIPVPPGVRVLIATRPVDFRKGADSLAALAKEARSNGTLRIYA